MEYTHFFPAFLKLSLTVWGLLLLLFICFTVFINKLPVNTIEKYKAAAIENKKRLGIKIYKF